MKQKEKRTLHGVLMLTLLLGLMMIPGLLPETSFAAGGTMTGDGTRDNPYQIEDYADLKAFAEIVNGNNGQGANPSACAILIDNIQCTDKEWVPINITDNPPYSGHFNGNGKIIKGLSNENREGVDELYNQGLFGVIGSGGLVENVGLEGGKIKGKNCVGGLAGFNLEGKIINCRNSGAVSGSDGCVGGLAGLNGGTITNCCNTGAVSGKKDYVGGLAGNNSGEDAAITNCYNTGAVSGGSAVGGVAGYNQKGKITKCYNSGAVSGSDYLVGGVAGSNDYGETTNCYYDKTSSAVVIGVCHQQDDPAAVTGLTTSQMTGEEAIGENHMDFTYAEGEENPWLVKSNGIDKASGEYYEYYPHLKGFNLDSDGGQMDADKIAPADWPAKPHVHKAGDEKVYFMPWEKTDQLPDKAGSYYLTGDVTLSSTWNVPGTVDLCLNDHSITIVGYYGSNCIDIPDEDAALNLYDCGDTTRYYYLEVNNKYYYGRGYVVASETDDNYANAGDGQKGTFKGGFITGGQAHSGGGVFVDGSGRSFTMNSGTIIGNFVAFGGGVYVTNGGAFTMNGGNIIGNKATSSGGGVFVSDGCAFTMNGGNIIDNRAQYDGAVDISDWGTFSLSGAPVIIGNKVGESDGADDVSLTEGKKITITGELQLPNGATTPQIGITIDGGAGVFTSGYSDKNPGEDPNKYFVSNDDSYAVYFDENKKEAQLEKPAVAPTITKPPTNLELTYGYTTGNKLKVEVSAAEGHTLSYQWYSCNAQGGEESAIDTTKEPTAATEEYTIPEGKDAGDYHYFCRVTAARTGSNTASADSDVATATVNRADLTIRAKDQTYEYDGQPHGEGDTAYEDAAQITGRVEADGLQNGDEITSLVLDGAETEIGEYKDRIQITGFMINGKPEAKDNYNVTLEPGTLTITKPQNSIVAPEPMTAKGKNALTIHWRKVSGAQGYDIFFSICGGDRKCKLTKTINGNKTFSWTKTGLKTKTPYKAYVKGWVMKDGKKIYISTSPTLHLYTANGTNNYTVAKSIKVKKTKVKLNAGKVYKIKAKIIKRDKTKKLMPATHTKQLRYISTNKKIATVSKSGKIKAKAKGSCQIYVYAANGVSKAVKVTVR